MAHWQGPRYNSGPPPQRVGRARARTNGRCIGRPGSLSRRVRRLRRCGRRSPSSAGSFSAKRIGAPGPATRYAGGSLVTVTCESAWPIDMSVNSAQMASPALRPGGARPDRPRPNSGPWRSEALTVGHDSLWKSVVSTTRLYESDREKPCAFNMAQLRRRPVFLDSFTNQIFGFPFTPAPFMTSFSRVDAAKLSARFRVLKSW